MNSKNLNDWLQIVALLGVIASLIFVGLQLKQTQEIALSETYQNRSAATIEMNMGAIASPEFLTGVSKIYRDKLDELTMQEAVALEWFVGTNLTILENNHLQFQSGFLSQEHWERNLEELRCTLTVPLFSDVANDWQFRASFKKVLAEVIREIPPDEKSCWTYGWDFAVQ